MKVLFWASVFACIAGPALAASREVQYAPSPSWVLAPPTSVQTTPSVAAPARVIYFDQQIRSGVDGDEVYSAYRIKLLSPEALGLGSIAMTWNPNTDDVVVHKLLVVRNGLSIDLLKATKFAIIQRENNLDYAMLDGALTATLQAPGLQVGDELEFAETIRRKETVFQSKSHGFSQLPAGGAPGNYRVRLLWPANAPLSWRPTPDLGVVPVRTRDGMKELTYQLTDPSSVVLTDGAPGRFNLRRFVEYSQFSSWAEVARPLTDLFAAAEILQPHSPIAAEAAQIAAASKDPQSRAEAALRLVQDRIRYVYVGLNGGSYRPTTADETWTHRFGDCKAKTVLLLALLKQLGVPAEAVLVNSKGGDGVDERLPTPAVFDHVLVRAIVGGHVYFLDGTRLGDHRISALPPPAYTWLLPLRGASSALERVEPPPPTRPQLSQVLVLDATAGVDHPAHVSAEQVFRGDTALQLRQQLAVLSSDDATRQLKAYWRNAFDWCEPGAARWRFDDSQNALVLTMVGDGSPPWEGDEHEGRTLDVIGGGFTPPNARRRPKEQDQAAPWATEYPAYKRWTTVIKLPLDSKRWRWAYFEAPVHRQLGGVSYWRELSFAHGVLRSTMSSRSYKPEITAAEAQVLNDGIPKFDKWISRVMQSDHASPAVSAEPDLFIDQQAKRLVSRARDAVTAGRLQEALDAYDRAFLLEPESPALLKGRSAVLTRLNRPQDARVDLQEAWRIDPLDPATASVAPEMVNVDTVD